MVVLSRHPPLRSQGARHSHPAGDGGEPLLGAVPAQMAIAVSLEARLSRPATSRTPSPIDEGRGSSGQGTAPCSSAQHTTNESSARHKAVGGGSHLMPSNANLQSNRAAIMWSFQVFALRSGCALFESDKHNPTEEYNLLYINKETRAALLSSATAARRSGGAQPTHT